LVSGFRVEEFKTQYGKFLGSISGLIFRVGSDSGNRFRFFFPGLNGSFNSLDYIFLRVYLLILEVSETDIFELSSAVIYWTWDNLPPSNIMLISNELIFSSLLDKLCGFGYNVVRSIFPDDPQQAASASTSQGRTYSGKAYWQAYGQMLWVRRH